MGNRDKRDDKSKKPKKGTKQAVSRAQPMEVVPPVELVRKKRRKDEFPSDEE